MKPDLIFRIIISAIVLLIFYPHYSFADTPTGEVTSGAEDEITFGGKEYTLSFSDDFEFFDRNKWARCPEQERQDAGGVWRDSCSEVKDGNLLITCALTDDDLPISGAVRSTGEYEQAFGLYHMRFKMEKADGLWYAFWLLIDKMDDSTAGHGATDGAELDIVEVVPHTKEYGMSVHWDGYGDHLKTCAKFKDDLTDDFYNRYHDLWYLWNEDGYRLYLDGTDEASLLFYTNGENETGGTCAVPCDMIISAEFGTWGGDVVREQLPARFYVDYVRVYKQAEKPEPEPDPAPDPKPEPEPEPGPDTTSETVPATAPKLRCYPRHDNDEDRSNETESVRSLSDINSDSIYAEFYENGKRNIDARFGKQIQGLLGMAAFSEGRPVGYNSAFTFNMTVGGRGDHSNKKGVLHLHIPPEYQKSGRNFDVTALDKNGMGHIFADSDNDPAGFTGNIDIDGYAFELIYTDSRP